MGQRNGQARFEEIFRWLSEFQHLNPHAMTETALERLHATLEICPGAVFKAMHWLGIDGQRIIGRARRSELDQLASTIHRFWLKQMESVSVSVSAPAVD